MADTLIVKILRNRSGGTPLQAGDIAVCDVDLAAIIDIQFGEPRRFHLHGVAGDGRGVGAARRNSRRSRA